ncbi:MAG: hypothetical protein ACRD16_17235 [Thermoanaerobaculia bacterium]
MRISMIGQTYDVVADRPSFRWEESAADSKQGSGTDYCIGIRGKTDRNWRKTFYLIQWEYFGQFKYHLREDGGAISFRRRFEDGIEQEEPLLKALEVLLKVVNASASRKPVEYMKPAGQFQGAALAV